MTQQNGYSLFRKFTLTGLLVSAIGLFGGSAAHANAAVELTVGLYPYVPRVAQFQAAIQSEWNKVQPGVKLNFLSDSQWDGGYDINPPANADVYVFDAMYFEYFRSQNWLEPLQASEIADLHDFVPYAVEGVKVGQQYFAIPQLGCASLLFYDKSDTALASVRSLSQLKNTLNQCTYTSQIPPDRRGLMIDMSGGTTDAALYLDAAHSLTGQYPYPLPADESQINPVAMQNLHQILAIGSYPNATQAVGPYDFATWYSNGWGRAYVGYSESMSQLSEQARRNVEFKILPFSDNTSSQPSFYADVIAVNPTVHQRGTRALAVQLANLMASTATMVKSIGPDQKRGLPPQYLMATRPSIFQALGSRYPLYTKMYGLTTASNPIMFKLNEQSRDWLADMKSTLKTEVLSNPVCGCDYPATQTIADNRDAAAICNATCSAYGGWSGNWTNQYPAAQNGSVCGCNSCPAQPQSEFNAVRRAWK